MLLLKETMPCLVLVTTKMIFTNKKTSRKYHIFKQSKFLSSVLVRSTVRYGSVRFCIFFHGSVRFGGSVKILVRSNTTNSRIIATKLGLVMISSSNMTLNIPLP